LGFEEVKLSIALSIIWRLLVVEKVAKEY
jgi:hypothetical protein